MHLNFVCRRPADGFPPSREANDAWLKLNVKHLGWRVWDFVLFFLLSVKLSIKG